VTPDFYWVESFWLNGFVGKARWRHLETQRHQEMLVAEGVKQSDLADRLREQLHRDGIGFEALHILGQIVMIEPDVSRLSRNASVLQSDAVGGAVVRSEEHTSELQSRGHLVCRLLLEKKYQQQCQRWRRV